MKKTLQDQYLLIKEGKGHKGVFLTEAKRDFPHIVPNSATFEEAAASLKTKNIISENIIGLSVINGYEPRKKETYETAFETFLAEAKKEKENEDEKVKAEEKKVSKPVEKDLDKIYDKTDDKNPDNLIFGQIMMGYYTEMKDPKNADKTMQQLKDIVLKNLAKDPIHYTKEGQFGVKDLGYSVDHPGLGEPKESKGKYKASGYGDLNEGIKEDAYNELTYLGYSPSVLDTFAVQDYIDTLKKYKSEELNKIANKLELLKESEENWKDEFKKEPSKKFSDEEKETDRKKKREADLERRRKAGESLEEITLRKAIQEMIYSELDEATQMTTIINPKKVNKDREDRDPSDKYLTFDKDFEKIQKSQGNLIVRSIEGGEDKIFITKVLHANLGPKAGNADLRKHLMDRTNIEPAVLGGKPVYKIKGAKINSKGNISVFVPVEKSLKESIEKDLAAINKEAEHEILQSKLDKINALIDRKQSQLSKLDEDEDMKALTDVKKVKEIQNDIKSLEKAKSKIDKMMGKHKGKKKEVIDETEIDENEINETELESNFTTTEELDQDTINGIIEKYDEVLEKRGIVTDREKYHIANQFPNASKASILDYLSGYDPGMEYDI